MDDTEFTLERSLNALRRRAWLIVLCVIATGGAAFAFSKAQTKEYTSTAALLFRSSTVDQQASGLPALPTVETDREAATNIQLVKLGDIARLTALQLGGGLTGSAVQNAVSVSPSGTTDIALVSATLPNPAQAAAVANAFARQFIAARQAVARGHVHTGLQLVQQQLAGMTRPQRSSIQGQDLQNRAESLKVLARLQTGNVSLAQSATAPTSPSSPSTNRNTALGLGLGLLLSFGLIFLLERLDRRIRDDDELEAAFGTRVLAYVPQSSELSKAHGPASYDSPLVLPAEAEAFRLLRAHLRYFNVDRKSPLCTLQVTSVGPGDGKSTIARNLAETAASMGTKTLLLEADLRRPELARQLGLKPSPGVAQVLVGTTQAILAVQSVPVAGQLNGQKPRTSLDVLVAGEIPPNPAELAESEAMHKLLSWLRIHYELVVVDAPPPMAVSDAVPLLVAVDGVLIVSRLDRTTRDGAKRLRELLQRIEAPVLGLIINGGSPQRHDYGGYYYAQADDRGRRRSFRRRSVVPQTSSANGASSGLEAAANEGAVARHGSSDDLVAAQGSADAASHELELSDP